MLRQRKNSTEQKNGVVYQIIDNEDAAAKVSPSQKDMLVLYSAMLSILRQKAG